MTASGSTARLILAAALAIAPACGPLAGEHRVITLAPHATELIHAAGAGHTLVGTVSSSDYPESARQLPRVGDGILLNQERIITLKPTVLVGWLPSTAARQVEPLARRLGARLTYSRPLSMRDIPAEVRRLGQLLGTERQAARSAGELDARIDELERRYASLSPVKIFIEVGERPLYTIGDDPLLNDALRLCSAVNVYAATDLPAPRVPVESVLVNQPGLIVVSQRTGSDASDARHRWSQLGLTAALTGHIHVADPDALYRPGPRLIEATEALCEAVDAARSGLKQSGDTPIK